MSKRTLGFAAVVGLGLISPAQADVTLGSGGDADEANQVRVHGGAWVRSDDPTRLAGPETLFAGGIASGDELFAYLSYDLTGATGAATGATLSVFSQGATTFNANGGVNDLGSTPLTIVALTDTITGYGSAGFQGMAGSPNSAVADTSGNPADFLEVDGLRDQVIGTANFDIDTIAAGTQMDITFNAAGLAYIDAAIGGTLSFAIVAPDAAAEAANSGARNFFALGGLNENGSTGDDDIAPSLTILGVDVPAPGDPADLDGDGDVDDADFGIAFAAFTGPNNGPSSNPAADLDGDGDVDDADFGIAFAAFTGPGGAAVPEPTSLALLGLGGLLAVRRRRA